MTVLIESMTKIVFQNCKIRMWKQEKEYSFQELANENLLKGKAEEAFKSMGYLNKGEIAISLLKSIENVNAIEVVDHSGNGVVLYSNWP